MLLDLNIGAGNGGTLGIGNLTIGAGSTITGAGFINVGAAAGSDGTLIISGGGVLRDTAAANLANYAMFVGSSPRIRDACSRDWQRLGHGYLPVARPWTYGLALANSGGDGSLTVSHGGSVTVGTANSNINTSLAIGRLGNGTLTLTDPGSEVTANGIAYVAHTATGTLLVENSATFLAAWTVGVGGIIIGDGNTHGVGGIGFGTIETGGVLDSQGYVYVGYEGTEGQLTILNGGTVQANSGS